MQEKHYLQTELEKRFQSDPAMWAFLQSGSLDGIWYWDLEHPENEWMSPEFWRLLGIDPATKRHDPDEWKDIIFPEDLAVALDNFHKHCADPNHPYDQIVRYRHADGSTVWVRCRGIAIRDETGKPIRMVGAHNDHTALKRAETTLRFGKLFQEAPIAMLLADVKGTILATNDRLADLSGFDQDALQGKKVEMLVPSARRAAHIGLRTDFGQSGAATRVMGAGRDVQLQHRDGTEVPVEVTLVPHEDDNQSGAVLAAIVDLTERKKAQDRLEQMNHELLRSNRELDDFAYTASHDLKEPLRGIAINANFLARENVSEKGHERIDRMVALAKRMEQLISDILFFSRLGRDGGENEDVDPAILIDGIMVELRDWMAERGGAITVEAGLPTVHADQFKVKSVFQNLIVNGLKYNAADHKTVEIGFQPTAEVNGVRMRNVFYVRDNGIGIEESHRDKVFRIFARLNREEEYGPGTGAGLSFVRKIIEAYGHRITFASTPGQGTVFYFSLPLKDGGGMARNIRATENRKT